jgi:hypothetical protein
MRRPSIQNAAMNAPPEGPLRRGADDAAERLFAGLVWLAATVALALFVTVYARNVPYYEDFALVPVLTGRRPFNLSWLVEWTVLEHRMVLAKTLLYPLWLVSGGDFRSSMFAGVAILAGLAYACMRVARTVRGRAVFADALFPVVLLNWGHAENVLFFIQLFFIVPVVLLTAIILLIATGRWEDRPRSAAALGACLVLLPLNGGVGMMLAPPLIAWAAYAAWNRWSSGEPAGRGVGAIVAGLAAATVIVATLYVIDYDMARRLSASREVTMRAAARTASETLSLALGTGGRQLWPWFAVALAALFGATACMLGLLVQRRRGERVRASGLLACLAAVGLMVAAIGHGRAWIGPGAGFPFRYSLLVAPAVVCVFLTAVLYGGALVGRFVQVLLFAVAVALVGPNVGLGLEYARFRANPADALAADVRAGVPPEVLGQRYAPTIYPVPAVLAERLAMLRDTRLGPYKR